MPKKVTFLVEALKNMVSQNLVSNVAFLAEPITRCRGDILSVGGKDISYMYIIDEGEVGIVSPQDNLGSGKRLLNMKSVDFVEWRDADIIFGKVCHHRRRVAGRR